MFSLQNDIIQSPWESPLDPNYASLWGEESVLALLGSDMGKYNPYLPDLDIILHEITEKFTTMKKDFSDGDATEAYATVYYFTQIQSNITHYIPYQNQNLEKIKLMNEIYTTYQRAQLEGDLSNKIESYHDARIKEQKALNETYKDKKTLTTSEMKFITIQMSNIESKYDSKISLISGMRGTNFVNTQVKKDPYANELRRKILILEDVILYLERMFKVCQEQVNTHKKIIENLMFLYNQSNNG